MEVSILRDTTTLIMLSVIVSFVIAIPIIRFLYKFRVFRGRDDTVKLLDGREQKVGTPVMGGLIIIITVALLSLSWDQGEIMIGIIIPFFLIAVMGGIDDLLNIFGKDRMVTHLKADLQLRSKNILLWPYLYVRKVLYQFGSLPGKGLYTHERTFIEFIVAIAFAYWLWNFSEVHRLLFVPFLNNEIDIGLFLPVIWVGMIFLFLNGVNLADGMDGLATGMLIPTFISIMTISMYIGFDEGRVISALALGSFFAYLYFNVPPARVQMGDVGALAIGCMLATLFILLRLELLALIIGLPYIIEFFSSYLQVFWVKRYKRRLFLIAPIHYHFLKSRSWSEEKIVMRFILFSSICALIGTWLFFVG